MLRYFAFGVCFNLAASLVAQAQLTIPPKPTSRPADPRAVKKLQAEAKALEPLVKTEWVKRFLAQTHRLPAMSQRLLYKDETRNLYFSEGVAPTLSEAYQQVLLPIEAKEIFYYYTFYESPLAYARPLDILGQRGVKIVQETKLLDFGYGTVGHLRLLAGLGAQAVGVDVDPLLDALYSKPVDRGAVEGDGGAVGNITLLCGRFPADERMKKEVGQGYDLVISKNTLKMGYVHPSRKTEDRYLVKLGVSDAEFVKAMCGVLKPGGYFMIYNMSPALSPPDKPFLPWTDGRCPFPKNLFEEAGFKVIEYEREDSKAIREVGHALGWDTPPDPMDLEKDLFANYTLVQKKQ